jgi:hypothetical protein
MIKLPTCLPLKAARISNDQYERQRGEKTDTGMRH